MSGCRFEAGNVFEKIVAGAIPCHKLFETEHALAILDAFPLCEGHCLLLPKASGYAPPPAPSRPSPPPLAAALRRRLPRSAGGRGPGGPGLPVRRSRPGA